MRLRLLAPALLALAFATAHAESPLEIYNRAGDAYAAGKYDEAVSLYETLLRYDAAVADAHYNAGCAYVKAGDPGRAALHFERALSLAPRDKDALFNLALIRQDMPSPVQALPKGNIERLLERLHSNELLWSLAALHSLFALSILGLVVLRGSGIRNLILPSTFVSGLLLVMILPLVWLKHLEERRPYAVILHGAADKPLETRAGPGEDEARLAGLVAGLRVESPRCQGGWCEVELGGQVLGWVPADSVARIRP